MRKVIYIFTILFLGSGTGSFSQTPTSDTTFRQPVSVKYSFSESLQGSTVKKVVSDYDDNIYVLTDKGLGRIQDKKVVKNLLFRPLAEKVPVDVTIQENTGYLYYLYKNTYLSNMEAGKPFGRIPEGKFDQIAVASDGRILLAGDTDLGIFHGEKLLNIQKPDGEILSVKVFHGTFYLLYSDKVFYLDNEELEVLHEGNGLKSFTFRSNEILLGTDKGYYSIDQSTGDANIGLQTRIPVQNIDVLTTVNGNLWAGTKNGAFMKKDADSDGFRYYSSKRWLNEDRVIDMTADSRGNLYLLTPSGVNEIKFKKQTYRQKAKHFQRITRQRHIRYNLLADVSMKERGDLTTAEMTDSDNDGLWTSFYLGSQAFRYAVTKDPEAKRYSWESFAAYERLLSISTVKKFPARTFERTGVKGLSSKNYNGLPKWHSSSDSLWQWKGTTSSDEFVGYIFVAALMDQFVAKTKAEKERVANFIDEILTHIISHDYNFVDIDAKHTLWGRWNPDYINWYAKTISDRKLGSTDIIAGLQLGYALTGNDIYKKEALRLINKHGYLENILISPYNIKPTPGYIYQGNNMGEGTWNHSDDEMEFLSYWVLYHYAFNKDLQQKYASAIQEYWKIERPERNPVWNLITLGTDGSFDKDATLWYLREYPMDLISWDMENSHRKDLTFLEPNFRNQYTKEVLSPAERPVHNYNKNEFIMDDGDGGKKEYSGAEYLLPYWMARYLNVIRN